MSSLILHLILFTSVSTRLHFFFSSRRRHTRCLSDWSSDVCSSDLCGGPANIATGLFTVDGRELLLWSWAHRTAQRWFRPTELLTWTVMTKAMAAGCDTFDFMGLGEFKTKFGAELDQTKYRWVRSRYRWLARARDLAERGYRWQQSLRGRLARVRMFGGNRPAEQAAD